MSSLDVLYYTLAVGFLIMVASVVGFVLYAYATLKVVRGSLENLRENHLRLGLGTLGTVGMLLNFFKRR